MRSYPAERVVLVKRKKKIDGLIMPVLVPVVDVSWDPSVAFMTSSDDMFD